MRREKICMNESMQKIFLKRFILFIVMPILILLCIGFPVVIMQMEDEETKEQEIMLSTFESALEQEVYDGAIQLSQFLLVNNQQMMTMMIDFYAEDGYHTYEYYNTLEEQFSYLGSTSLRIDGIEFYYQDGRSYSHKTYSLLSWEEIKSRDWYTPAKETPNQVYVSIDLASDFIANISAAEKSTKKELIFVISPDNYDSENQLDVIIMFQECNTFKELEELEETDYSAYIVDGNQILFASDDKYTEILESEGIEGLNSSVVGLSAEVDNTTWEMILIREVPAIDTDVLATIVIMVGLVIVIFIVFFGFIRSYFLMIAHPISHLSREMNTLSLETDKIEVQEDIPYEIRQIQEQYNEMLERVRYLVEENKEQEYAKHQEELKALQLQINPHFLSNTLNTIKFMAQVAKFDGIRDMTDSLMQIMDCSFRNHDSFHTLESEKQMLEAYGYIMNIRYAESFELIIKLEEGCKEYQIPKLILQPFIENALFHGLEDFTEDGVVEVLIEKKEGNLQITIRDNGHGMTEEKLEQIKQGYETKVGRVGITNVIRRLKLYYGELCKLEIKSEVGKGTTIQIQIPISEEIISEETKCIQ